jgi:hypothetical protein
MFLNNNYLRIIYTSFSLKKITEKGRSTQWITMGIKTSCNHKRQLYLLSKESNDINQIKYYKEYFKILARVIIETKRSKYNNQIINSTNKLKTTWSIINSETNRLNGHTVSNYENSPDTFNDHFLSIAEQIIQSIRHSDTEYTNDNKNPMHYLSKISPNPFPNIKCNNTSTKEIERIFKSYYHHLWADCLDSVGYLTSHNLIGLHGLLRS